MPKKKISVITTAYNEEGGIRACIEEVRRVMTTIADQYDYEHIVADNCSKDKTLDILRELAAADPRIKVIANSRNFGAEKSAFNALKFATGDAAVGITADMQEPPTLIPKMAELWEAGNEVVYGIYKNPHEGVTTRSIRKLYYWLVDKLSSETLPRDFTGFSLLDRRVVDEVLAVDDYAPYTRGLIATVGFKQTSFLYERGVRKTGESKHGLSFLFDFGLNGLISHSNVPIRAATFLGLFLFVLSVLAIIVVIALRFLKPGLQAPGITTVVTVIVFFSGIQLLLMGLLGEYVGAIHSQTRRKPFVIVKEAVNVDPGVLASRSPRTPIAAWRPSTAHQTTEASPHAPSGRALVFGGQGLIGAAIANLLEHRSYAVTRATRTPDVSFASLDPMSVVVWVHDGTTEPSHVDDVARTLQALVDGNLLAPNAALCVVGSVERQRPDTLSQVMSDAALGALVRTAARDLAPRSARINAVVGTQETPIGRPVTVDEIAHLVAMLVNPELGAVTGQSIGVSRMI